MNIKSPLLIIVAAYTVAAMIAMAPMLSVYAQDPEDEETLITACLLDKEPKAPVEDEPDIKRRVLPPQSESLTVADLAHLETLPNILILPNAACNERGNSNNNNGGGGGGGGDDGSGN